MCELYTLIKNEDNKECYIQFLVYDDEELNVNGYDDVCEYLFKHHDLFNCVDFRSFVRF